jgi:hypothetical protein
MLMPLDDSRGDVNPLGLRHFNRFDFPLSILLDRFTSRLIGKNILIIGEKGLDLETRGGKDTA